MSDSILVESHNNWIEITLNRPKRLNSFTEEMLISLRSVIEDSVKNQVRSILITGNGRGFCAGQDLADRDPAKIEGTPDLSETLTKQYNPLIQLIRNSEIPVICAVNGVAAGAGANLALACDIVIAAEDAKFIQSFSQVGLIPDSGGSWILPRLVGEARAKGLALLAESISARQAEKWGLIWEAVPNRDLMFHSRFIAEKLAKGPTLGLGLTKKIIQESWNNNLDEQLELEAKTQKICGESADYAAGVTAFFKKQRPTFVGK